MPIHGIAIPQMLNLLAEVDNTTLQYSGAPAKLNLKAPYRNSIYNSVRVGAIMDWVKTFNQVVADNNDGIAVDKLIDSSVNFVALGVAEGDIVVNDATGNWTRVTAVDGANQLSLADNYFPAQPVAYRIFDTPALPEGWVECDGAAIVDALSRWNGVNAPDLNNATPYFLKGANESGGTGGGVHAHVWTIDSGAAGKAGLAAEACRANTYDNAGNQKNMPNCANAFATNYTDRVQSEPLYYEVVKILKIRESA